LIPFNASTPITIVMPAHSCGSSAWPSSTSPASAASTGCTLENIPKKRGGTRRRAIRSSAYGSALSSPAAAAQPSPAAPNRPRTSSVTATGR